MLRINRIDNLFKMYDRKLSHVTYQNGWTLRDYFQKHEIDLTDRYVVVSGKVQNDLDFRPKNGDEIVIMPKVADPFIAGAIAIFKIIAAVAAVAMVGYSVYQAITYKKPSTPAYSSTIPDSVGSGIGMDENASPTYGWDGIVTTSDVGIALPVVYGRHRVGGNIINSFVSNNGNDNYLNCLLALCEGEIDSIDNILINDNPLSNYTGITQYERYGTNNQLIIPNFEDLNDIHNIDVELTSGHSYVYTTSGPIDSFEIYLRCPNGLYSQSREDGEILSWSITYEVSYKLHTSGTYTLLGSYTITDKTRTILRKTIRKDGLVNGTYDIQIRKTSSDESFYNVGQLWITSVNEISIDDLIYPNTALLGFRFLATNQLSGSQPNITAEIKGTKMYGPDLTWVPSSEYLEVVDYDHYYWDPTATGYKALDIQPYERKFYTRRGTGMGAASAGITLCNDTIGSPAWDIYDASYRTTGYSMVFRMRPLNFSGEMHFFWSGGPHNGSYGYSTRGWIDTSGHVNWQLRTYDKDPDFAGYTVSGTNVMSLQEDNVVVVTVAHNSATGLNLYLNGVLEGTAKGWIDGISLPRTDYPRNAAVGMGLYDPMHYGGHGYGYAYFGTIGEVRMYNRVLSASEIAMMTCDEDNSEPTTGLVASLDMSDRELISGTYYNVADSVSGINSIIDVPYLGTAATMFYASDTALTLRGFLPSVYTANPARCLRDLILNTRYGLGEYVIATQLDDTMFEEAARWCDEKVADGEGGYEKRMTFNVVIDSPTRAADLIQQLASSFRGMTFYSSGMIKLKIDKEEDPVQIFGMGNIVSGSFSQNWKSIKDKPNVIEVTYLDAEKNYEKQRVAIMDETSLAAGNPIRKNQVVIFSTRLSQSLREGRYAMLNSKHVDKSVSFRAGIDAVALNAGDVFAISHDATTWGQSGRIASGSTTSVVQLDQEITVEPGYSYRMMVRHMDDTVEETTILNTSGAYTSVNVLPTLSQIPAAGAVYILGIMDAYYEEYRTLSVQREANGEVTVVGVEYDEDVYDESAVVLPDDNFVDWTKTTPDVTDLTLTEKVVKLADGTIEDRIDVWFNKPSNVGLVINKYASANIYLSTDSGDHWSKVGNTTGNAFTISSGIGDLQTYDVAVVSVSEEGRENSVDDSPQETITVAGKTSKPSNVAGFTGSQVSYHVHFSWTACTDVDLKGYEIRQVTSMVAPWSTGTVVQTDLTGTSYDLFGLPEATYYFAIKAKDTTGNYSDAASYISVAYVDRLINNNTFITTGHILSTLTAPKLLFGFASYWEEAAAEIYGYWRFNESSGTSAPDLSLNDKDGSFVGTPSWVAGKLNNAIQCSSGNYIDYGDILSFERTQAFSVSCWFKYTGNTGIIIQRWVGSAGIMMDLDSSNRLNFRLVNTFSSNHLGVYKAAALSSGSWYHVVWTYDGSSTAAGVKLYLNNNPETLTVSRDNLVSTIIVSTTAQTGSGSGVHFVDELLVHTKVLSSSEVAAMYNSGTGVEYDYLVDRESDLSGQANHARYYGITPGEEEILGDIWSLPFNGTTDYLEVNDSASLSFAASAFSIGSVITVNAGSTTRTIVSKWDTDVTGEKREYRVYLDASEKLVFELYDESANDYIKVTSNSALATGNHFIVVTADGTANVSGLNIYVDGVAVSDTDDPGGAGFVAMENLTTPVYIGASKNGSSMENFFDDNIAIPFISGEELSSSTIWILFNKIRGLVSL